MGRRRVRLSSLARMAVQKQTAASSPTKPWITGQHFLFNSLPITTCTKLLSTSTHAPSFRASIGHLPGEGDGTTGGGAGGVRGGGGRGEPGEGGGGLRGGGRRGGPGEGGGGVRRGGLAGGQDGFSLGGLGGHLHAALISRLARKSNTTAHFRFSMERERDGVRWESRKTKRALL